MPLDISDFAFQLRLIWGHDIRRAGPCYVLVRSKDAGLGVSDSEVATDVRAADNDPRAVERRLNHKHVADLVNPATGDVDPDDLRIIAQMYMAMLSWKARTKFPDVQFEFEEVGADRIEEDPVEYQVTFSAVR